MRSRKESMVMTFIESLSVQRTRREGEYERMTKERDGNVALS